MKTKPWKALVIVAVMTVVVVLVLFLKFGPSQDTSAEFEDVFSSTEPASEAVSTPVTETSESVRPTEQTELVRFDAQPSGSKAKIAGTSSVHDWTMESLVLGGFMEVEPEFPESALTNSNAIRPRVEVFMPVRAFKSYSKRMDEVMQEHMDEPKHKRIEYKLIELKPKPAPGSTGEFTFEATGVLTIKGAARTNQMPVVIEKRAGKMKVTGSTSLKMTDFGVQPPKITIPVLGSITTGDDITITFEWSSAAKAQ
ncbi:MAG: YceI family protein [Verrucomicrobia bacterium]|nr:YceI family protein [Verrucomicrobiota bacterium]